MTRPTTQTLYAKRAQVVSTVLPTQALAVHAATLAELDTTSLYPAQLPLTENAKRPLAVMELSAQIVRLAHVKMGHQKIGIQAPALTQTVQHPKQDLDLSAVYRL